MALNHALEVSIQKNADAGLASYRFYLNPILVVAHNLSQHGFTKPFQIFPQVKLVTKYRGQLYDVFLTQPAAQGTRGIWLVSKIYLHNLEPSRPIKPSAHPTPTPVPAPGVRIGIIPRTAALVRSLQTGASGGNPADTLYLNLVAVFFKNLPSYGFIGPFSIKLPLTVEVFYQSKAYDILMTQPVTKGPKGIWAISGIQHHHPV